MLTASTFVLTPTTQTIRAMNCAQKLARVRSERHD